MAEPLIVISSDSDQLFRGHLHFPSGRKSPTNFHSTTSDIVDTLDLSPEAWKVLDIVRKNDHTVNKKGFGPFRNYKTLQNSYRDFKDSETTPSVMEIIGTYCATTNMDIHHYDNSIAVILNSYESFREEPTLATDEGDKEDKEVTSIMTMRVDHVLFWMIFEVDHQLRKYIYSADEDMFGNNANINIKYLIHFCFLPLQ